MSAKKKLEHFAEFSSLPHTVEPDISEVLNVDYKLKGKWAQEFFGNSNPIVLELGCGKGEYTLANARSHPNKNFLGIDIKGARMWRGAKTSHDEGLTNVGFIRTRIEHIKSFFGAGEISEIWLTFSDPQVLRPTKRLTGSRFLGYYQNFLEDKGVIHLKTDSDFLYEYTCASVAHNQLAVEVNYPNLYVSEGKEDPILSVRTHYEQKWLEQGYITKYLQFRLQVDMDLQEPEFEFDGPLR